MKQFNKLDYTTRGFSKALFLKWSAKNPKESAEIGDSYTKFKEIYTDIIEAYVSAITETTHGTKLPFYMGELSTKFVNSSSTFLVKEVSELENKRQHLNLRTNGKVGKCVYTVKNARRFNWVLPLIAFHPSEYLRRMCRKDILDDPNKYPFTKNVTSSAKRSRSQYIKKKKLEELFSLKDSSIIAEDIIY